MRSIFNKTGCLENMKKNFFFNLSTEKGATVSITHIEKKKKVLQEGVVLSNPFFSFFFSYSKYN